MTSKMDQLQRKRKLTQEPIMVPKKKQIPKSPKQKPAKEIILVNSKQRQRYRGKLALGTLPCTNCHEFVKEKNMVKHLERCLQRQLIIANFVEKSTSTIFESLQKAIKELGDFKETKIEEAKTLKQIFNYKIDDDITSDEKDDDDDDDDNDDNDKDDEEKEIPVYLTGLQDKVLINAIGSLIDEIGCFQDGLPEELEVVPPPPSLVRFIEMESGIDKLT
jgi:hypothetical protein